MSACLLFLSFPVLSQAVYGSLNGTITDSSGAIVPDAKVTLNDIGKGITTTTTTNESGFYIKNQLPPGNYTVTVEKTGFQKAVQQNVTVSASLTARADATLNVGDASTEVTVTTAPPALETDRAELNTTLSAKQIIDLPVLNRNFTSLTLLTPGSTLNTYQQPASENPQGSTLVNTNGILFSGTNYLLDGMNNNDVVLGIVMVNPALDSVGESTVATGNYDAEYTQAGGAVVRVETKSGTNEIHGSAFEYLQNNVFQARNPLTQGLREYGAPDPENRGVPPLRWNQFGGALGGPIVKNKVFAFADYQATRRRQGGSAILRVPTPAERGGNLSDLALNSNSIVYDPATGASGQGRTPFAENVIPSNRLSAPAVNLLNRLPLPNIVPTTAGGNNYAANQVQRNNADQGVIRVDHYVTEKLHYFARYNYFSSAVISPGPLGVLGGQAINSFGFEGRSNSQNHNGTASASYTVNPTTITNVRFGFSRYDVAVNSLDSDLDLANQIGIPGLNFAERPDTFGLPRININGTGGVQIGHDCNCPLTQVETLFDFVNDWSKVIGNHSLKWGGTVELAYNTRLPSDSRRSGAYDFLPGQTSLAPAGVGGLGLASFLVGAPNRFQRYAQNTTNQQDRQNRMFYFIQDTWRLTPKLTLNYGVRWDTWFPDYSLNSGQGGRYDVNTNEVLIPGVAGISKSGNANTQYKNISPRISFAYAANEKTVIRGGYGRSYFQGTFGWTFNNIAANVYPSVITQSIPSSSPYTPVFALNTAPPAAVFPTIPANGRLPLPDQIAVSATPVDLLIPYVDQYNLTIERELPGAVNVSLGYVGNLGRHLNGGWNLNAAVPGPGDDINQRRPLFQRFGLTQTINNRCDCTNSNYNGLQLQVKKRFSNNYSLIANYTFSKSLDYAQTSSLPTNQYNAASDYGPADFDRRHAFTLAHTFAFPIGKGQKFFGNPNRFVQGVIGGWQFSGITSYYSGLPFSPVLANNASLNSDMTTRAEVLGDSTGGLDQTRNQWYRPSAFGTPALYQFGNAGRNSLRGPMLFAADWSLFKQFNMTERTNIQFRWEVFNAFNNTNLALPVINPDAAQAGVINDIATGTNMRNMQLSLRLAW